MADIRDYFKAYRKKLGLTLSEFGERYGVASSTVWSWENKASKNFSHLGVQPGDNFGKLTVVRLADGQSINRIHNWYCRCECGGSAIVIDFNLVNGSTKSCGCIQRQVSRNRAQILMKGNTLIDGTRLEMLNCKIPTTNASGVKGVCFYKNTGKWNAYIYFKGTHYNLGYYHTKEAAAQARRDAELKYFAPILNEHGMSLKPQEIDEDLMKDDTYKRRPFYDFGKGID